MKIFPLPPGLARFCGWWEIPRWQPARVVKSTGRGPSQRWNIVWLEKKDGVLVEAAAADDPDQTEYSAGLTIAELDHFVDDSVAPAPPPAAQAAVAASPAVPAVSPEVNINEGLIRTLFKI